MIKFENTEVMGWEHAIRGMRNPMNSWEKSDSRLKGPSKVPCSNCTCLRCDDAHYEIGPNDLDLMRRLAAGGPVHAKYRRMITVYVDITAPLYWWKEFDTYRTGTAPNPMDIEMNSCSTMHKIAEHEFTRNDFSLEHLKPRSLDVLDKTIMELNVWRDIYINGYPAEMGYDEIKPKDKEVWWQMFQLLPSSYNQKRTVMMNYEVLANIYKSRKNHKLDEWREHEDVTITYKGKPINKINNQYFGFCDWIKTLPYSELITGPSLSDIPIANEIMEEAKRRVEEQRMKECIGTESQ